jgi:predicted RNA-binding Zn-ribbon protein involved in translation (DUF1610 family)
MESADQKFRQQKENYEHMSEGELCALAAEAYNLTEIAREALKAVLSEKGIVVRLWLEPPPPWKSRPPYGVEPNEDLVVFSWPASAEIAGDIMKDLTAAGIPSFLCLEVRADDVKRADAALKRAIDEEIKEADPDDKDYAVLCPKCRSAKVVMAGRSNAEKFQWSCDACGYQWQDEGIAQEAVGGQSWPGEEFSSSRGLFGRVDRK